ncbi:MAG: GntR family transcriptional regulator [Sphingomonadales bacterium]|nr:GntR family transcriptional regulator [Sphingomonadales bacterium]
MKKKKLVLNTPQQDTFGPWVRIGQAHQSLNDLIIDALRQAILQGQFKLGERLPEAKLAELFGVSRIPIREALRVLSHEGLVEINPRKGARIPLLSADELREIIELRAELEAICARNVARDCTPEICEQLQALLNQGNQAANDNDLSKLRAINKDFHSILATASKNRYLAEFAKSLRDRTYWLFSSDAEGTALATWREHAAILEAVMAQDEQLAAALASRHVKRVGTHIADKIP